jgi:hypothetical protein
MKILRSLTLFTLLLTAYHSHSQIIFLENFNYPAGDSIGAYGWIWNTGTTNTILVVSPGLTYSGYPMSGIGNACRLRNNGNDAYKPTDSIVTSGNLYMAFMVRIDSVQATGDYFFAMLPSTSTTNYTARFYAKDSSGGVSFGISKNALGSNPVAWTGGTYARNTTYLVVVKYTFLTGSTTDDEVRAFIFTSGLPVTEPATPTIGPATGTSTDVSDIGRVALRQGSATIAPTLIIDGIRVTRSWGSIVSIFNNSNIAGKFHLSQNYPNPFNPSTVISFSIPENSNISLKLFDLLGREIKNLAYGYYTTGNYSVQLNSEGLSSGIYIYSLEAESVNGNFYRDARKLTLIK